MSIDDLVTLADILRPLRDCVAQASHLAHQPGDTEGEATAAFHSALQAKVGAIGTELLRRLMARELPPNSLDSNVPVLRLDMNGRPVDAETPKPSGRWVMEQRKGEGSRGGGKPHAAARPNGDWPDFMLMRHERHVGSFGANFSFCQHTECRDMRRSFNNTRDAREPA